MSHRDMQDAEAARIGPLLGAIATVPAGALVVGRDASAGAPLFAIALAFIAASYVAWICTDGINEHTVKLGAGPLSDKLFAGATHCSWSCVGYGAASLLASIMGFVGMHSTIRTPLSVEAGFGLALALSLGVVAHTIWTFQLRNQLSLTAAYESAGHRWEAGQPLRRK